MQRLSERDTCELLALANALPTSPAEAMSVEALAAKTELPSSRVRKLLVGHARYFVNVGRKDVYALNRRYALSTVAQELAAADSERGIARRMYGFNVVLAVIAPGAGIYAALLIQRSQWKEAMFVCLAIPIIVALGVIFVRRRANV